MIDTCLFRSCEAAHSKHRPVSPAVPPKLVSEHDLGRQLSADAQGEQAPIESSRRERPRATAGCPSPRSARRRTRRPAPRRAIPAHGPSAHVRPLAQTQARTVVRLAGPTHVTRTVGPPPPAEPDPQAPRRRWSRGFRAFRFAELLTRPPIPRHI